jgi:16S rRNA (cytidine1402-2'-O)-methyltransferase
MPGTLFVVATPIGNLEDLTARARRILGEVDLIAAEDTRRTAKLLAHCGISRPMISLHAHNEHREAGRLVAKLLAGSSIALVSDAGTPGISDPGTLLVREARARGVKVSPIPGPSAVMAALSVAGLPADRFVFMGFPPRSGSARGKWLNDLAQSRSTAVFFEAPHRITRTLADVSEKLVQRQILVFRELTKIHEELVKYTSLAPGGKVRDKGELVVVVSGRESEISDEHGAMTTAIKMMGCLTETSAFSDRYASALVSGATGLDPRSIRSAFKKHRIQLKRTGQLGLP